MDEADAADAARTLMERSDEDGGTLIIVGSPRTEQRVAQAIACAVAGTRHRYVAGDLPRYLSLLRDADEMHVTDFINNYRRRPFTRNPAVPKHRVLC